MEGEGGKKILIFGFDGIQTILALKAAAEPFGAELVPVGKSDYGRTLAALAGLEEDGGMASSGGTIPGRMAVLCGLEKELEPLLAALNGAGAGSNCLKAVLTPHNREWTASRLYMELAREDAAVREAAEKNNLRIL